VADIAVIGLLPACDLAQWDQFRRERDILAPRLEPIEQFGRVFRLDRQGGLQALAQPTTDILLIGHQIDALTTSTTSSTSSSRR
jgi:hypothetical protein